jgi:nitrite reductase/ring-hydroxylating ferredoxin subunit
LGGDAMEWRDSANAPAAGTRLAGLEDLPEGAVVGFSFGKGKDAFRILVIREGRRVNAFVNKCPHYGVPLNNEARSFYVLPGAKVMCMVHCAVFSLESGECVDGPVRGDHLTRIDVTVESDGAVVVAEVSG